MPFRFTRRPKIGPFVLNIGSRGPSSVSFRAGGTTTRLWSRTGRKRGLTSVNLPGPFSYRTRR